MRTDVEGEEEKLLHSYILSNRFHSQQSLLIFLVALATCLADIGCDIYLIARYLKEVRYIPLVI